MHVWYNEIGDNMVFYENEINFKIYSVYSDISNGSFGPGRQHKNIFHFVQSGKGSFIIDGKVYNLAENDCFYFNTSNMVHYFPDKNDPWTYSWISGSGKYLEDFALKCGFSKNNDVIHIYDSRTIKKLFSELSDCNESYSTISKILLLMGEIYNNSDKKINISPSMNYVSFAKKYIENNCHRKIEVSELCELLNIERSYLCRLFKKETQLSPQQYIINYKLRRANDLLNQNISVNQAARSVGYEDQAAFTKLFKKFYGFCPKERKNAK